MERLVFDCFPFATEEKQIIIKEKNTLRKETKNSYL
jgi:hypothetical protein